MNRFKATVVTVVTFCIGGGIIGAAGWLACLIFDIVEKDFSLKFFIHLLLIVLSIINGFIFLKKDNK